MAPERVDIPAVCRIWRAAPTSTARVGASPADRRRTRGNERAISSIQHTKWHTGHGERWGIKRIDRAFRVVGLLAQLVEQRTFNPQQQAPAQGFLNRFAIARHQGPPPSATEARFRHTVCHCGIRCSRSPSQQDRHALVVCMVDPLLRGVAPCSAPCTEVGVLGQRRSYLSPKTVLLPSGG